MQNSSKAKPIHVIGLDAGGPLNLSSQLQELIFSTSKIAAPTRLLDELPKLWGKNKRINQEPEFFPTNNLKELFLWLEKRSESVIVFASGDPLWFGIGKQLLECFSKDQLCFYPAPSSLQLAFARIGQPWQNASWISLHGRDPQSLAKQLQKRPKALAILTDPNRGGAKEVREILRATGLENAYSFWILERLGHSEERVRKVLARNKIEEGIDPLHLVVLIAETTSMPEPKSLPFFGIDDGVFLQNEEHPGLMTKRELRVQILADLNLPDQGVLWDIGAGVGSIGLEALRIRPKLELMAIEKYLGSKKIIESNAKLLEVYPSSILEAEALSIINSGEIPKNLITPNRVVIGGGINRKKIIEYVIKTLIPGGIVVIPLATIESISELKEIFQTSGFSIRISQHQSWKGIPIGDKTRLDPANPVFIFKGTKNLD